MDLAVGLGSNLGNSVQTIYDSVEQLKQCGLDAITLSPLYETPPVDCVRGTPNFINAALTGRWEGAAPRFLEVCADIEVALGRPRTHASDRARTIDLDLLLFGDLVCYEGKVKVPHPLLEERMFVLMPLNDIAPDWPIPPHGKTVAAALERLKAVESSERIRPLK